MMKRLIIYLMIVSLIFIGTSLMLDSCYYNPYMGDWKIYAEDNCYLGKDVDLKGNNFICEGKGTITHSANIENMGNAYISPGCVRAFDGYVKITRTIID